MQIVSLMNGCLSLTIILFILPAKCSKSLGFLGSHFTHFSDPWKRTIPCCPSRGQYQPIQNQVRSIRMAVSGGGDKTREPRGPKKERKHDEATVVENFGKVQAIRQRKGAATGIRGSVKTQGKKWDILTPVPPSIRVASGTAKGRKLTTPDVYLRPMMGKVLQFHRAAHFNCFEDRQTCFLTGSFRDLLTLSPCQVKQALFSILREFDILRDDAVALDTFAGCGSVGIEALSQVYPCSATSVPHCREPTNRRLRDDEACCQPSGT
jgi:hypothetical protein